MLSVFIPKCTKQNMNYIPICATQGTLSTNEHTKAITSLSGPETGEQFPSFEHRMAPSNETANAIPQSSRFRQIIAGQVLDSHSVGCISDTHHGGEKEVPSPASHESILWKTKSFIDLVSRWRWLIIRWLHAEGQRWAAREMRCENHGLMWTCLLSPNQRDDLIGKYEWYIERDNGRAVEEEQEQARSKQINFQLETW